MKERRLCLPFVMLAAVMLLALAACGGGEGTDPDPPVPDEVETGGAIVPQPIPPGFDFPGNRDAIQELADSNDTTAIRTHSWHLWAGMTTDSKSSFNDVVLPIWETWCGTVETFGKTCGELERPSRHFAAANQIKDIARHLPEVAASLGDGAESTQVVSFNKFNPSMANYVATPHPGPGGVEYDYSGKTQGKTIADLNNAWPEDTPEADRKVAETPYDQAAGIAAMELKPVFLLVKATGLTPVPFWQGPSDSTNPGTPTPNTWKTCVLFDPSQPDWEPGFTLQDATPEQIAEGQANLGDLSCETYKYAPLGAIYHAELTDPSEAEAFNAAQATAPPDEAQKLKAAAGDYVVLTAMHVSTKEIVDWTWQTFWWQAGENPPTGDHVVGGIENMTDDVVNEWRTYAMCTTYLQTEGVGSSEMNVCYNPYLETAFGVAAGLESNCMSCHGQAIVGGNPGYPSSYDTPIDFNSGPYFAEATSTDFSWAVQGHN